MTVCGFNSRMGAGLRELFEGMYDAIESKSRAEGVEFSTVLSRELVEIPSVNAAMCNEKSSALKMFQGLNVMALAHFEDVPKKANRAEFMKGVERFISLLEKTENYAVSIPQPAPSDVPNVAARASAIGRWAAAIANDYIEAAE